MSNYILTGHWKFNQTLVFTSDITAEINLLFIAEWAPKQEATSININAQEKYVDYCYEHGFRARVYWAGYLPDGWGGQPNKQHIRFVTPQTVNEDFYNWFIANATPVSFIIPVTSNGITTLATAGKYCDKNIEVNVDVGMDAAFKAGIQAEYDAFWDAYQDNGNRKNYRYAFYRAYWNDENFKPKYNIVPTSADAQYAFQHCGVTDLKGILERQGVTLDFSRSTTLYYCFGSSAITHLPELNCVNCTSVENAFASCANLVSIDKFIVSSKTTSFARLFHYCYALENVIFDGVIAANIEIGDSTMLSRNSITSLVNALSTTTSGRTATLSQTAKEAAFTEEEWAILIATKPNWTISLV